MGYRVAITDRAMADAAEAHAWIFEESPERALKWFEALIETLSSLAVFPSRYPTAAESRDLPIEVRQLLHGTYRILFCIDEQQESVTVLRIRHGARLPFEAGELIDGS